MGSSGCDLRQVDVLDDSVNKRPDFYQVDYFHVNANTGNTSRQLHTVCLITWSTCNSFVSWPYCLRIIEVGRDDEILKIDLTRNQKSESEMRMANSANKSLVNGHCDLTSLISNLYEWPCNQTTQCSPSWTFKVKRCSPQKRHDMETSS